ncbi:MAG TPA: DUF362 domain-containing protein [Blastocatellia bacterium]|nr:DUF362 domain-containing protein [Blastocatellia bacterium]HMV87303.1 DUF362 domain-containing protein [Blastocatellia bacterium]HMX24523.1 DUF362 domain-containing protein [Blastocatellia bacterium]HMY72558.1 DUF362 domain-containing protein [Blastocatellia bacterium]HMZ18945.1 DUF362 domain-containing protein [Blastocatellia bacterium]
MKRRTFVQLLAASPLVSAATEAEAVAGEIPKYRVVSKYKSAATPGMPGAYPGRVVSVKSAKCLDETGDKADAAVVREMMERGIRALTGERQTIDAWRRFIKSDDVVAIKVNAGGRPYCVTAPEILAETIRNLMAIGVKPQQIYVYERFQSQLDEINYAPHLPEGVTIFAAERGNRGVDNNNYDPHTYVEADFFGEDDTRSNMIRLLSEKVTKIINIPNMKDHGATGVTGCLKNIAYGSFSNVARTHFKGVSHTFSFVGTLAAVEPLRSRTVLQIMDGLRGVWHGGPFAYTKKFLFYPKTIMFGTDPVAIDRLLLDIIEAERKAHGAISVWNRDEKTLDFNNGGNRDNDPNVNIIIREPGHIEYAAKLGLGEHDLKKIRVEELDV